MRHNKVLSGSLGLALCGLVAASCGKSTKPPGAAAEVAGQGGQTANAGEGGAGALAGASGGGVAGDAGAGLGGVAGDDSLTGAGMGGGGASGCSYAGHDVAVGERFAVSANGELCTCDESRQVRCIDGCGSLPGEFYHLLAQARDCDQDKPAQCQVLKTVYLPFAGNYVGFFNEASLGALDGLKQLTDFHGDLDCDAPITPPKPPVPPTIAYCDVDGRCKDFWTGLNLLQNGGFETAAAGAPTSWTLTPAPAFALLADAHTGDAALAATLSDTAVTYRLATNVVSPSGGSTSLSVSGFYRVDRIDSELSLTLSLDVASPNGPSFVLAAPATAGEWLPFVLNVDASGEQVAVAFNLHLVTGPATTIAFDDLKVEQTSGR